MHPTESQNDPTNLRNVFEILSGDLNTCFEPLQRCMETPDENGNYSFEGTAARTYVSVAFACIASVSTCIRKWAIARLQLDAGDDYLEEQFDQLADGQEMTPLEKAVRLSFALLERACNVESQWHANEQWWTSFRQAVEIKYRLTSPTSATDLEISAEELLTVVDAEAGFRLRLAAYLEEPVLMPQIQLTGE